jgi:hypothetical protein
VDELFQFRRAADAADEADAVASRCQASVSTAELDTVSDSRRTKRNSVSLAIITMISSTKVHGPQPRDFW